MMTASTCLAAPIFRRRDSFEAALSFTPQDPGLLYNLGQCYDRMGDWRKAEQYYLDVLANRPNHGDARQAEVALLYRTGRTDEANRAIQEWLHSNQIWRMPMCLTPGASARTRHFPRPRDACSKHSLWNRIIAVPWWKWGSSTR